MLIKNCYERRRHSSLSYCNGKLCVLFAYANLLFILSYVFAIIIYLSYHAACEVEVGVKFQCHHCLFRLSIWLGNLRKLLHVAVTFTFKSLRCARAVYVCVSYMRYYGNIILGQNNPLTDFVIPNFPRIICSFFSLRPNPYAYCSRRC